MKHHFSLLDHHGSAPTPATDERPLEHYDAMLSEAARSSNVPVDLLKAVCWHASGWRQFEPDGRVLVTPTPQGTRYGCMQLNDIWHPDAFPAAMHDAEASIRYSARLLDWLHEQTSDWNRAVVAFFGHDRRAESAARRVAKYSRRKPWNDERGLSASSIADRAAQRAVVGM